jgi:hypothetical protein
MDLLPCIMKSKWLTSRYFISPNFKFSFRSRCTLQYWVSLVLLCSSCYCTSEQQIVSAVYVTRSNFPQQTYQIDHHRTTKFLSSIWILLQSYRQDAPRILRSHEIMFRKNRQHSMFASLSRIQILLAWRQVGIKDKSFCYCRICSSPYSVVGIENILPAALSRNCGSIPRTGTLGHIKSHTQRTKDFISLDVRRLDLQLIRYIQMMRKLRMCGLRPTFPYISSYGAPRQFYFRSSEQCTKYGCLSAVA